MDFSALENTWFNNFWRILTEGISRSEINSLFDNVTFISFNYDRCIEHLLIHAIRNYYDVNHENAIVLVRKIKIFHPYGTVGALSGIGGASRRLVAFGEDIQNGPILLEVSKQIKTFTERIHDETELKHMRDSVSNAKVAVFLGFAFHEQNMDLLSYGVPTNIKQVFATSCSVSSRDRNVVVAQIVKALGQQLYPSSIELGNELENNLTCFELFKQYWRSLKQS